MTLKERMLCTIRQQAGNVLLRADFAEMGGPAQITLVLNALQASGVLWRIGAGVYAKTRTSSVTGVTVLAGSLETLASEAFLRLGVQVTAGRAAADYNEGKTTQLPGAFVVNTGRRRITRKITVGGRQVIYENNLAGQNPPTEKLRN